MPVRASNRPLWPCHPGLTADPRLPPGTGYQLVAPAAIAMDIEFVDGTFLFDQAAHSRVGTFGWQKLEVDVPASKPIR